MAELVDALVSNTNEETRAGSTPALGTKKLLIDESFFVYCKLFLTICVIKNKKNMIELI